MSDMQPQLLSDTTPALSEASSALEGALSIAAASEPPSPPPAPEIVEVVSPEAVIPEPVPAPEPIAATPAPEPEPEPAPSSPDIQEPRYWRKNGWIARVIKNEDDDGWAVEVSREGDLEPVLVSPWTMGRDKKNPKPFDHGAFTYMVKTASEVMRRTAQQRERMLNKSVNVHREDGSYKVTLNIIPDEDDPHAFLSAFDEAGEQIAKVRVAPNYKLTQSNADKWIKNGCKEP